MANPLIKLEVMRRFRSPLAAWGIPLVVLLPGLAVVSVYASSVAWSGSEGNDPAAFMDGGADVSVLHSIGRGMFGTVAVTLFITLLVLVPAIVGGSIAGERHSQTLQPLQLTAMTPTQIVLGKLGSSLAYVLVALLCATPVLVIPFLLGGVSATEILGAFIVLLLITVELAAISLAFSAIFNRPTPATIVSLLSCFLIAIGPYVAFVLSVTVASMQNRNIEPGNTALRYLTALSPVTLGSWVATLGDNFDPGSIRTGDKLGSLLCFVVITLGALAFARKKVSAPVERDR